MTNLILIVFPQDNLNSTTSDSLKRDSLRSDAKRGPLDPTAMTKGFEDLESLTNDDVSDPFSQSPVTQDGIA